MTQIFMLSPASCGGRRAELLFGGRGTFPLALRLRAGDAVPLGEAFSFLSGLYFRGKLAYAQTFAAPPAGVPPTHILTTDSSEEGRVGDALAHLKSRVDYGELV